MTFILIYMYHLILIRLAFSMGYGHNECILEVFICVWGRRGWEAGGKHIEKTDILNTHSKETVYHVASRLGVK